jgi:predicted Zn-dependent peptidase
MKSLKFVLGLTMAALLAFGATAALAEKQSPPEPEKMKKLSFPDFKEFELDNGLDVVVVEHHEQPVASIWMGIYAGDTLDPEGKSSMATFVATMLNKGTSKHTSDELAEWIESVGGEFNASSNADYTFCTLSVLSEYIDTAYEFLSEVLTDATFPADEFETERKRMKTGLEFQLSDPNSMADRHFMEVVYGHHPYAVQPTPETVEAVTREDLVAFHDRNYVANNAIMFVVGDVKEKDVKKAAKKYFGDWEEGTPDKVDYPEPPERTAKNISLYHRPGSVQTNLYVGHIGLRPDNPDWPKIAVANRVLGGGATGRLFMNLREDKGWTYGAYSNFAKLRDIGYFRATANVRTEVTDSALTEMLGELERMVDEPVDGDELKHAKSYLIGNFPTTIETPTQIAGQIGQIKLLGLDKSYLEDYRKKVAEVGVSDVQEVMQKYLHPDRMAMVLVGDANEIKDKVEPIASVTLYDIEGNEMSLDELSVQGTDFDYDTSKLKDWKVTYGVKVQDAMDLGNMDVALTRDGDSFTAAATMDGMLKLEETVSFGAGAFEPEGYDFNMNAMGQVMKAEYSFENGVATGSVEGGPEGPKEYSVDMVQGTVLAGTIEYVIATLPLDETKSYKFPVLDAQSGALQNYSIEVVGEEDVLVPAGQFSTYKVKIKRSEGDLIIYCTKDSPHVTVKQENPAQQLKMELKAIEM